MPIASARLALLSSAVLAAVPVAAAPRLDGVLTDHAVVQRGQPIAVAGEASPGEAVMIGMAGRSVIAKAGKDGRFSATLPALPAGGPYDVTIAAPSGASVVRDVLVGDVFLCSGQSNMELAVRDAQDLIPDAHPPVDDQLRLLTVAKALSPTPLARFTTQPQWTVSGPDSVPAFSAACFYMVQSLRRTQKVPIGAIHSSWGGSRISAWMSDGALRQSGMAADADLLALYARDPATATRRAAKIWEDWYRKGASYAPGAEPWQPDAALEWKPVPAFTNFETWGVPELADYNGMIWYQRSVELTADQARGPATLVIGGVDDADQTWVNGQPVGSSSLSGAMRVYAVPAGTLKAGRNVVTVNVDDVYAYGGMTGPAEAMRVTFADGSSVPLGIDWRYAIAKRVAGAAPRVPWADINGAGTLFNAMIAPLAGTRLAGFAWYQGESDTGIPGYDTRLTRMIADWRQRFGGPASGLAVVQLASYGTPSASPGDSGWGIVRDAQRRVVAADPHAGLAVTLDVGDQFDIHPGEKHQVGLRLAQAMRAGFYGEQVAPAGPAIATAQRNGDGGVTLRFTGVTGALHPQSADRAIGFELCDAAPGTCRFASGQVDGSQVTLPGDGRPATHVRYAFADAPATNLADEARLPVGTFDIPVR